MISAISPKVTFGAKQPTGNEKSSKVLTAGKNGLTGIRVALALALGSYQAIPTWNFLNALGSGFNSGLHQMGFQGVNSESDVVTLQTDARGLVEPIPNTGDVRLQMRADDTSTNVFDISGIDEVYLKKQMTEFTSALREPICSYSSNPDQCQSFFEKLQNWIDQSDAAQLASLNDPELMDDIANLTLRLNDTKSREQQVNEIISFLSKYVPEANESDTQNLAEGVTHWIAAEDNKNSEAPAKIGNTFLDLFTPLYLRPLAWFFLLIAVFGRQKVASVLRDWAKTESGPPKQQY